jgi:hypothetical protein
MPKLELDLQTVEKLAAEGLTQRQAAERLALGHKQFQNKLANDKAAGAAWKRGAATRGNGNGTGNTHSTVTPATAPSPLSLNEEAVLDAVNLFDGATVNDIHKETRLDASDVGRCLRSLSSKNLIYNTRSPSDTNPKYYAVSDAKESRQGPSAMQPIAEIVGSSRTRLERRGAKKGKRGSKKSGAIAKRSSARKPRALVTGKPALVESSLQPTSPLDSPAIDVQPVLPAPARHALEGAAVELNFMRFHGVPSNKYEEVMTKLAEVVRQ